MTDTSAPLARHTAIHHVRLTVTDIARFGIANLELTAPLST